MTHNQDSNHPLALSFTDLSVWCYACEAYIDNMVRIFSTARAAQLYVKKSLKKFIILLKIPIKYLQVLYAAKNAAHRSKFGSDLVWSYGDRTPQPGTSS